MFIFFVFFIFLCFLFFFVEKFEFSNGYSVEVQPSNVDVKTYYSDDKKILIICFNNQQYFYCYDVQNHILGLPEDANRFHIKCFDALWFFKKTPISKSGCSFTPFLKDEPYIKTSVNRDTLCFADLHQKPEFSFKLWRKKIDKSN